MDKVVYDMMDWAGIEELVYSESSDPHRMLGPHTVKDGLLIQAFVPTAVKMEAVLKDTGKRIPMDEEDENGFFACFIPNQHRTAYRLSVTFDNGDTEETEDPYAFAPLWNDDDLKKFAAGTHYEIYEKMGAHPLSIDGISGVYFSVWAPEAMRVSVVGNFNLWDGRRHQMRCLGDSGIFELFIPGVKTGELYKYEVKTKTGDPMLKADPYGFAAELRPNTASIVTELKGFAWDDADWMQKRGELQDNGKTGNGKPFSVYEVHLGSWIRKEAEKDANGEDINGSSFYNYREIAPRLASYVKEMNYTHVELMPVMEHPLDNSWGYQVTGYYAPTSRFGTPEDFMWFMNYLHKEGIGVILDWVPAHFPRDLSGLAVFDGSHVYESADPRRGEHPHWGTMIFDYGKPQVRDFLIANALFWTELYHADGIRMDAVASMLYLDYGRNEGEWIPNIYGGHENLEAIAFLQQLNTIYKGRYPDALLIAEESTAWPMITGPVKDQGLGFDYKWNMGWMNDFLGYMKYDPLYRGQHYGELTFSMLYQYSENFILVLSHDEVVHGKCSLVNKMPGATFEDKFANLRAAYGLMATHPGKKLLFMGQEFGQMDEWNEEAGVEWGLLEYPIHQQMKTYVQTLNRLYRDQEALWKLDNEPEGFEWINCHSWKENVIAFLRKSSDERKTLLVVLNFTPIAYPKWDVGVPYYGKYTQIFNSDSKEFGGSGMENKNPKMAKHLDVDDKEEGITVTLPPYGVLIFSCERMTRPPKPEKKPAVKKTAGRKTESGKTAAGKTAAGKTTVRKTGTGKAAGKTAVMPAPEMAVLAAAAPVMPAPVTAVPAAAAPGAAAPEISLPENKAPKLHKADHTPKTTKAIKAVKEAGPKKTKETAAKPKTTAAKTSKSAQKAAPGKTAGTAAHKKASTGPAGVSPRGKART